MDRNEMKWMTGAVVIVAVALFFLMSNSMPSSGVSRSLEEILTVSMPRPIKDMILGFTLEGRNIKRELIVEAEKAAAVAQNKLQDPGPSTRGTVDRGRQAASRRAAMEKARQAQEKAFRARIIEESERYKRHLQMQERLYQAQRDLEHDLSNGAQRPDRKSQQKTADNTNQRDDQEPKKRDPSAWKSLVLAQPTPTNVQEMIEAYVAGDLDAQTYYEIVESLMTDNSEEKRKMGMWALTSTYHSKAFVLASHAIPESEPETQKRLNDYLLSYNRMASLGYLDEVLKSNDSISALAAADVITQGIEKVKSNEPGAVAPTQRGFRSQNPGDTLSLSSYNRFIPTLQMLVTRPGSTLSQWAQNLLSQLRKNSTPA